MARTFLTRLGLSSIILVSAPLTALGCASQVELGGTVDGGANTHVGGSGNVGGGGAVGGGGSLGGASAFPGAGGNLTAGMGPGTGGATSSFQRQVNNAVRGIDLLLMIDNSSSMADKQATLADAVPQLLGQLAAPNCVDANGNSLNPPVAATLGAASPCPAGSTPEFNPVNNIHIGIVTSSLGDHGAGTICTPGNPTSYTDPTTGSILQPPDVNDQGHLVGTLARATAAQADPSSMYADLNALGFLEWGNSALPTNVTQTDLGSAERIFADMVIATHEIGCGYESQLEGWFRFLIDPVPPIYPIQKVNNATARIGSDDALLNQRAAFLRPDSLVAIVMLTDENDCSIRDTDVGWVSADTSNSIPTGSTQCATNPNDKCCYNCTAGTPAGCANGCPNGTAAAVDDGAYQANIRCWNQKRRFGYDFLYPTSRYVVALTKKTLCPDQTFGDMDCDCAFANRIGAACDKGSREMPNPLYSTVAGVLNNGQSIADYPNAIPRADNSSIFLAGIVGVPWQDIGTTASGTLRYIPVTDPAWTSAGSGTQPDNPPSNGASGIWDMIYGYDAANIEPKDVHMVESLTPRANLPGPTAAANADPFNGHEYNTALEDLEYACIFPLEASRACACPTQDAACEYENPNDCCNLHYNADGAGNPNSAADFDKPLCQNPAGGAPVTTQYSAKAYPGLREIAVLHDYALSSNAATQGNSIVASICPRDLTSVASSPGYGYNPVMSTIVDRMKQQLKGSCYPRPLSVNSDGSVPCSLVEVISQSSISPNGSDCNAYCESQGRNAQGAPSAAMTADVTVAMRAANLCDNAGNPACTSMCVCQLQQESGSNLATCQNATDGSQSTLPPGFCYVDPSNGAGSNAAVVAQCPSTDRRLLRFVGNNRSGGGHPVPLPGSYIFLSCGPSPN